MCGQLLNFPCRAAGFAQGTAIRVSKAQCGRTLLRRGNARLVTRSPEFFEDVTDQAAATPYLEDDTVKLARVPPPLAAAALVAGGAAAAGAAAAPKAAAAVTRAAAAAPAAAAVTSTPAATAAAPLKEYEQSGRVTWEGE